MDCYEARLESFHKTRRVKTKTGTVILKWPHPDTYLATPEQLAEAGFYFSPTVEARDSVKCFMCRKELDEWEQDDDPISVHFARCRDICAWAVARCGNVEDLDANGGFTFTDPSRAPTSKAMEKARHETFASSWPHDHIRGHGASSKKMAKAGFLFAPHSPGDDTAICVYCTTTLSGWDAEDDPLEEHRKRVAKSGRRCAFFEMLEGSSKQAQTNRGTKSMSRSTSQPLSKRKGETALSTPEDESSSDDMSELTQLTTAKSTRTTRSSTVPSKTPGSRKSTRSVATSGRSKSTAVSETEEDAQGSGSEVGKRVSKSKSKSKKGTKKAKEPIESIVEVDEEEDLGGFVEEAVPQKPKRGRPPGKSKAKKPVESVLDPPEVEPPLDRPPRARGRPKLTEEIESESPANPKPPSSQPKTKSSAKLKKADEPLPLSEEPRQKAPFTGPPHGESMPPPKAKANAAAVARSKAIEVESDDDDDSKVPEAQEPIESNKKTPSTNLAQEKAATNGLQAIVPVAQTKGRKSSSTSDDAGYATAEQPMEVDDEQQPRERTKLRAASLHKPSDKHSTSVTKAATLKTDSVADVDVDMQDAAEPLQNIRPRQLSTAKPQVPIPRQRSESSAKPLARMASRGTGSLARPPSRIGTEIVDISSDEDDELDVLKVIGGSTANKPLSTSSAGSGTAPPTSIAPSSSAAFASSHAIKASSPVDTGEERTVPASRSGSLTRRELDRKPTIAMPATASDTSLDVKMTGVEEEPRTKPPSTEKLKQDKIKQSPSPFTRPPTMPNALPFEANAPPTAPLPSFDEDLAAEEARTEDPAVEAFTPFLSIASVSKLASLTEDEGDLTLEQYIRRELERQYQQFKEDGDRQIALFKQRAAEARKVIETL